ncbi:hypothetical protein [Nocardia caishijiensis]|uniref:Uncharacterized protein n=1 Tax=Nocardia caishijiensis TaxID=184756 RepID=A0ABQ6YF02_9NOCA|nr:hypothetical protein [Nocardia caishijiensis]KAF0835676.1 hypothetical protein FNL39_1217 [Nocardia caishijiensis]
MYNTERIWTVPTNATTIVDEELDMITFAWFPENDPVADRMDS